MDSEIQEKKNHEWLTQRWNHLKILRNPMLLGTSMGWALAAMFALLAFKAAQAGITSHVWGWFMGAILAALVIPAIMFELMRRGSDLHSHGDSTPHDYSHPDAVDGD